MIRKHDLWLPDGDQHVFRLGYQKDSYKIARDYVEDWTLALDVGAHVGIFSNYMLEDFGRVIAYEPVEENIDCLWRNAHSGNLQVRKWCLGNDSAMVQMINPKPENSGAWEARPGNGSVDGLTVLSKLDDEDLPSCGLLKIDVQGMEEDVLLGGEKYIMQYRPVILIEGQHKVLSDWGFRHVGESRKNHVWAWSDGR